MLPCPDTQSSRGPRTRRVPCSSPVPRMPTAVTRLSGRRGLTVARHYWRSGGDGELRSSSRRRRLHGVAEGDLRMRMARLEVLLRSSSSLDHCCWSANPACRPATWNRSGGGNRASTRPWSCSTSRGEARAQALKGDHRRGLADAAAVHPGGGPGRLPRGRAIAGGTTVALSSRIAPREPFQAGRHGQGAMARADSVLRRCRRGQPEDGARRKGLERDKAALAPGEDAGIPAAGGLAFRRGHNPKRKTR